MPYVQADTALAHIAFRQILTMVILMIVGFFCTKFGLLDEKTSRKLSNLVLYLVFPLIILVSYQRPFQAELLRGLLLSFLLGAISFAIAIIITHIIYRKRGGRDYCIEKFACVYPNSGFLGIPLIYGIFGGEGVFYLTGFMTVFFFLFWTHGMIVMSGKRDFSTIKKAFVSPPILAIVLGFVLFVFGIQIPETVFVPLTLLADVNTPLAMLVAGASIYGVSAVKTLTDKRIYAICAMRLVVLPALTIAILAVVPFYIPDVLRGTIVVLSACPVAANLILMAHRYDRDHAYASQAFAASTIISMGTIPLLLLLL